MVIILIATRDLDQHEYIPYGILSKFAESITRSGIMYNPGLNKPAQQFIVEVQFIQRDILACYPSAVSK